MDLSPDKRYVNKLQEKKNVPLEPKDQFGCKKEVSWMTVSLNKKDKSLGIFNGGRCSRSEAKMTTPADVERAIKQGDLVSLLSFNTEPSVETLFQYVEKKKD